MIKKLKKLLSQSAVLFPLVAVIAIGVGFVGVNALSGKDQVANGNCDGICVALTTEGMRPDELAVEAGSFVQFNSADGKKHNLSVGEGGGGHDGKHEHRGKLASGDIAPDEGWRVRFNEAGTYELHDHYNPKLNILVIVYDSET